MSHLRIRDVFIAFVLCAIASGCGSTAQTRVTNETLSDIGSTVAHSSMSGDDKAIFARAVQRANIGDYDVTNKTVQIIIDDQRLMEADERAKEVQEEQFATEARARRHAIEQELANAVAIAFVEKGFKESDPMNGDYESLITIALVIKNTSTKAIRSFNGTLHFQNTLGEDIENSNFTYEDGLERGASVDYAASMKYNEFADADVALRRANLSNIHLKFEPKVILFRDGSRLEAPSE